MKLTLDLHDIYNRGGQINAALRGLMDEAVQKKAKSAEIIPGKGSGQLKKRVLRFLDQKEVKALYHRVEKDSSNFGRVYVPLSVEMMGAKPSLWLPHGLHGGLNRRLLYCAIVTPSPSGAATITTVGLRDGPRGDRKGSVPLWP